MLKMNLQFHAAGDKYERKYLGHYVDSSFGGTVAYVRLGKDIEEYNVNMNPDIESKKNILGETSNNLIGFDVSSDVDTYYAYEGDALFTQLCTIINTRATGSALETTVVEVLINGAGTVEWAYRENVLVVPGSIGGPNGAINVPFQILYNGGREAGTWDATTKTFTVTP